MYESGNWICDWEQDGEVQTEFDLKLTFDEGSVSGAGKDVDGDFEYSGTVSSDGRICMVKHYVSGRVDGASFIYEGARDAGGGIRGRWRDDEEGELQGAFWLRRGEDLRYPSPDLDGTKDTWAGLRVDADDIGLDIVRRHYTRAQIDRQWSVLDDRGYTWWAGPLAQRVWSEPPRDEQGDRIWLLRAQSDFLRNVPDVPATYAALARHNTMAPLSSLVYDPSTRRVRLACSFPVFAGISGWSAETFSWAAAVQASAAYLLLFSDVVKQIGGEPDQTSHPTNGKRPEPDEMVTVIPRAVISKGEAGAGFGAEDFKQLQHLPNSPSLLTNADATGLTAEFPWGGHNGACRDLFGPAGMPNTALLRMTMERHPLLGNGCFIRLILPVDLEANEKLFFPNLMNRYETQEWVYLYGIGGWGLHQTSDGLWEGLCHTTFLPAVLHAPQVAINYFMGAYGRMLKVKERFHFEEPQSLPDDVDLSSQAILEMISPGLPKKRKERKR